MDVPSLHLTFDRYQQQFGAKRMAKVLIFGAGGVGCIYAWILENGGAEVTAVCRTNYTRVRDHGITIRSKKWGTVQAHPKAVNKVSDSIQFGPFDYIVVSSKAFPGTEELIHEAVTSGTTIVLAQNGIGIEDDYLKMYPSNPIIAGVVYLPTTQIEPGIIEHNTPLERFEIGTHPPAASTTAKASAERFSALFAAAGASCPVFDDIQPQRWSKIAVNACLNPICALTLCDDANYLRSSAGAVEIAKGVMREVGVVAAARGYHNVNASLIDEQMSRHVGRLETGGKEPSMLTDIRNGRPIEVEAILGNTLRIAEECGVVTQTPYLQLLYALAKGLNFATVKGDTWKPLATA